MEAMAHFANSPVAESLVFSEVPIIFGEGWGFLYLTLGKHAELELRF